MSRSYKTVLLMEQPRADRRAIDCRSTFRLDLCSAVLLPGHKI